MTKLSKYFACIALLLCGSGIEAQAASSAASSASDSVGTSVGSASGSIQKSSGSSSKTNEVAEGNYKIVAVTNVAERAGMVRMKLQAVAANSDNSEFLLTVPQVAFDKGGLALGRTVSARQRAYGAEFANAETRQLFFLVLNDDWYRELRTNAVAL